MTVFSSLELPKDLTWVFVAVQIVLLTLFLRRTLRAKRRTAEYKKVNAVVVESKVIERVRPGSNKIDYEPHVLYEYEFAGQKYRCNNIMSDFEFGKQKRIAEGVRRHYPVGKRLAAFVDPSNPEQAFLESMARNSSLGFTMVLIILGICAIPILAIIIAGALK